MSRGFVVKSLRKSKPLLLVCSLLLFKSGYALSAEQESAHAFVQQCGESFTKITEPVRANYCMTKIHTVMEMGPFLQPGIDFCVEGKSTFDGLIAMSTYLVSHPDKEQEDSLSALIEALGEKWPCK
jgi:hypothetical protein